MPAFLRLCAPTAALLAATLLALAGCTGSSPADRRSLALAECRLPKIPVAAQCGTLEVPENRAQPGGRRIGLHVALLPANTLSPKDDPLFILAGGPGQAASALGPFAALFTGVRKNRDIVLVDQRGTGRSAPLTCAAFKPIDETEAALELDPVPRATRCAAELAAHGVDAAQYTTAAWIGDLDAVRAALGYERINLWGGSYGTRAALEYLRRYPQHVRSAVLDGVAPPGLRVSLDVWRTRDEAITAAIRACGQSPSCSRAHPDLGKDLETIDASLGKEGRAVDVPDPRTGATKSLTLTLDHVIGALQPLVYAPELAAVLPEVVGRAAHGDFAPLYATASLVTGDLVEQINGALYYSVTCTEDASRVTPALRDSVLAGVRARNLAGRGLAVCEAWPQGRADPVATEPVTSDVPVLLLSGGLDPVTPPAYGDEVARTLSHSRHIVAAGYGHNVSPHACAPRLIAAFIDDPSFATLPESCVHLLEKSTRPPFWPDRLGPQP